MLKKSSFNIPLCIILLGIILRFAWVFYMNTYPETDFMWYHTKGIELSRGMGFLNGVYPNYTGKIGCPTAFRPIGYPLTLALLYSILGTSFLVGKIFNILLSTISMVFLHKTVKLFFCDTVANLALAIFAFSPLSICYTSILGSETLFQTLLVLILYVFFSSKNPFTLGLLVGYLALVRPIGIFFGFVFILFLLLDRCKCFGKFVGLFSIAFLLVVSGWFVRNYIQFKQLVYSTNGGYVLYVNNNPYATGSWSDPLSYPQSPFKQYMFDDHFDELAINDVGKKLAIKWIQQNPKRFLFLASKRIFNSYWNKLDDIMWAFTIGPNTWDSNYVSAIKLETFLYRPFYILTFIYIIYSIFDFIKHKSANIHTFVLLIFLYFSAMMFILEGNSRYVFPLHPIYSMGVAFIICSFLPRSRAQKD